MKKTIIPDEAFIKKNYEKTISLIETTVVSDRKQKILDLFSFFDTRYAVAPASQNRSYYSAFQGGLAYHNLNILQWVGRFASLMAKDEFSNETLLVVSLLHSIGVLGTLDKEYFLPQTNKWKKDQGALFEINEDISFVKIPHRSLFLLQRLEVKLTEDEYLAILLQDGQGDETNRHYNFKEPKLAQILQFAKATAIKQERDNYEY